jgi:hypothetical protein
LNLHAYQLEKLLLEHGCRVVKESGRAWLITGPNGRVLYSPETASCWRAQGKTREQLRGSPRRIAEIIESWVKV